LRGLPAWRITTARILLGAAAIGAFTSFVVKGGLTVDAGPATQSVEAWRMVGLAAFAGLFALLTWRPLAYPGVFEIPIGSKAALAVLGITLVASADQHPISWSPTAPGPSYSSPRISSQTAGQPGEALAEVQDPSPDLSRVSTSCLQPTQ
jgi:hypothetical protein